MNDVAGASALAVEIERLATSYLPAFVIFAAVDLGIFDELDVPRTMAELATRTGATPDGVRRLCRALASLGLLTVRQDQVEARADARDVLSKSGAHSIATSISHHQRQVAPLMFRLPTAVRGGGSQHAAWSFASGDVEPTTYAELARHPAELETFLTAMDRSSAGVGVGLARELGELGVRRLVDLGCGGGAVAREALAALPALTVESFDLAEVAEIARARSRAQHLEDRHLVRAGDILSGVTAGDADGVLLSAILADWNEEERARILATAKRALRPGGHLFVSETLLDDDRTGPPAAAMLSLVMLVAMRGDQLSGDQLRVELERAGFVDVRIRRGAPRDLVIARLP